MNFRHIAKENLHVKVPGDLVVSIRVRAAKERRSVASVATELLCVGLGQNPTDYGLEPVADGGEVALSA